MAAEFQFLRPLWFLALLPLPWVLWRLSRVGDGARAWRGLVDESLLPALLVETDGRRRRLSAGGLVLGWLLAVAALAGPVWQRLPQPVFQAQAQRVIVLDLAASMNARDQPPSRLARARFEVLDLLARAVEGQTALLVYGAEPFVVSPLTADTRTIAAQVLDLETALLPVQGPRRTDLALRAAGVLLSGAGSRDGELLLVTDVPAPFAETQAAVRELRASGYRTSILGMGTEAGAPVPLADGTFQLDEQGAIRLSRQQPERLQALAEAGGGRYVASRPDEADTRALLPAISASWSGQAAAEARADRWREEGPWLLLALLPLAALAFRRGWLSPPVLLLLALLPPPRAEAGVWEDLWWRADQQGARAFSAGAPARAAEHFQRPDWRAAAQYQAGAFAEALDSLAGQEGPGAAYNRGNALARLGRLEEAIAQYEQALAQNPDHADARHNRDLLRQLLASSSPPPPASGEEPGEEGEQEEQREQNGPDPETGPREPSPESGSSSESGSSPESAPPPASWADAGSSPEAGPSSSDPGTGSRPPDSQEPAETGEGPPASSPPSQDDSSPPSARESFRHAPDSAAPEPAPRPSENRPPAADRDAPEPADRKANEDPGPLASTPAEVGEAPDRDDLLDTAAARPPSSTAPRAAGTREAGEGQQAMEHLLRTVPEDPGGLLRQRFLLQHLRRHGQLP